MDLGLDRERPDAGLDALTDGVELCLDLGLIGGRTFVNNASFGAYAQVVQSPAYRDDKRGTTLQMLPELLSGERGPRLGMDRRRRDDRGAEGPVGQQQPLRTGGSGRTGRRARLDTGTLGVIAVTVDRGPGRRATPRPPRKRHSALARTPGRLDADADQIPVGIDGEAVMMTTPVRCRSGRSPCGCAYREIGPACPRLPPRWTAPCCCARR